MDPFKFSDLNDYVILEIFKYLPLREKTRLERTERRWSHLLSRTWFNQKRLCVFYHFTCVDHLFYAYSRIPQYRHSLCQREDHRVFEPDVIRLGSAQCPIRFEGHFIAGLLSRCVNLEVLIFNIKLLPIEPQMEGFLAKTCPKLVHLEIRRDDWLLVMPSRRLWLSEKEEDTGSILPLECLDLYGIGAEPNRTAHIYKYLANKTLLERFMLNTTVDVKTLQLVLPKLKMLEISHFKNGEFLIHPILEMAKNLESLKFQSHFMTKKEVQLIAKTLTKLRSLRLFSCLSNITHLVNLEHLEDIEYICGHNSGDDLKIKEQMASGLEHFLQMMGNQLRVICLNTLPVDYIHHMPSLCPNLKKIAVKTVMRLDISCEFDALTRLHHLTHLILVNYLLSLDGIRGVLRANPKLKKITLGYCYDVRDPGIAGEITFAEAIGCFAEYAKQHPKRRIEVVLVTRWSQFHTEFVEIIGNLRVFCPKSYVVNQLQL